MVCILPSWRLQIHQCIQSFMLLVSWLVVCCERNTKWPQTSTIPIIYMHILVDETFLYTCTVNAQIISNETNLPFLCCTNHWCEEKPSLFQSGKARVLIQPCPFILIATYKITGILCNSSSLGSWSLASKCARPSLLLPSWRCSAPPSLVQAPRSWSVRTGQSRSAPVLRAGSGDNGMLV